MTQKNCRVVVLISGEGSNLQTLIDESAQGTLPVSIEAVISNRPDAGGLKRAQRANIPTHIIDHTEFSDRYSFDIQIIDAILKYNPDLVILAGYMRIMTPDLVNRFSGRMINIHPSLLPKYPGLKTHQRALENGDSEHGSTVHFVTEVLDGGPVIAQSKLNITNDDNETTLIQKIKRLEHKLYPHVIQWFADNRLALRDNQTYFDGEKLQHPIIIE
ncbi:phosphoribosylglycinamide formyltransferase [Pleionea sediminis]|uniref:phosphoribosylglycinamide formyltransferase n=1 Tax=Pleionea sediminis TaxID=2569479 RepID=UPI001184A212|nr:phosphoribosylglycinamide formyltransferase [Pleionea sediminis]